MGPCGDLARARRGGTGAERNRLARLAGEHQSSRDATGKPALAARRTRAARALCRIRAERGRACAAYGVSRRFHRPRSRAGAAQGGDLLGHLRGRRASRSHRRRLCRRPDRLSNGIAPRLCRPGTLCGTAARHGVGGRARRLELYRRRFRAGLRCDHDRPDPRAYPDAPAAQAAAWSWCTIAFALGQAIAGYGFSFIFAAVEHPYPILFLLAATAFLLALAIDIAAGVTRPHRAIRG